MGYAGYPNTYGNMPQYGGFNGGIMAQPTIRPNTLQYATEEEIRAYIVPPNSQVLAMDREKPLFYTKSTDELGRSIFNIYRYEKIQPQTAQIQPQAQSADYVTKDEVKSIFERLERVEKAVKGNGRTAKDDTPPKA